MLRLALLLVLLVLAACGSGRPGDRGDSRAAEAALLASSQDRARTTARPRSSRTPIVRRRVSRKRVTPPRRFVTISPRDGGWVLTDLLETVAVGSNVKVLYEPTERIAARRVEFVGSQRIPRHRTFEWLQAVLSYHGYVLVPLKSDDRPAWFCMASGLR